ncbi:hypothetical protein JXA47_09805, partial [Candidatus Sumerlaeota bacterium]|nr:hypothetical protein [Candidatus Sumerlaeota bacterium]
MTIRGSAPGQLRVWELTAEGDLAVVQLLETPHRGDRVQMDPFGRFLVHPTGDKDQIDLYEILPDQTLILADSFTRPSWSFFDGEHTISPDGELFITLSRDGAADPDDWYLEAFQITDDLRLEACPGRLKISPDGPEGMSTPIGELGCVSLGGEYVLLQNNNTVGTLDIVVLPLST